ncbi:hypothetical protein V8G54_003490 [Vigna mungo]|uniref:Uncharacterized protein n=1 Tax=Vigna mungo TaxID=3915 RepID=A0AAQ3SDW8_VIGMU
MTEPDIVLEVVHIQHKSPHSIPQLVSDRVFLIVKGHPLNTGQRRCIDDAEGIVGHNPSVLVEGQPIDDGCWKGGLASGADGLLQAQRRAIATEETCPTIRSGRTCF